MPVQVTHQASAFASPHFRLTALARSCAAVAALALGLSGCVGYNVYPPDANERGFSSVNADPFPQVITSAVAWTVLRYPPNLATEFSAASPAGPDGPFAVNLPAGMTPLLASRITKNIGFGAQPLTPGSESLPVYHVARVWVSGDEAKVDVIRPVRSLLAGGAAGKAGKEATQGISVRLRGGLRQWTVTSHRAWSFSAMPVPAFNYITTELVAPASTSSGRPSGESSPTGMREVPRLIDFDPAAADPAEAPAPQVR